MRILVVPSSYPNSDGIGNTFVEQLVNAMSRLGHICTVVSPFNTLYCKNPDASPEYELKQIGDGLQVEVYRPRYWMRNIPFMPVSTTLRASQSAFEKAIKKYNLQFDCIYCHFFASALPVWHFAHKKHIPLFIATGESKIRSHFQKPCISFSWKKFRQDTNGVICVSTKNLEECLGLNYADREKCKVFPNGADLNLFRPNDKVECRKKLGFDINDFITITVGEFSSRKGQERIIEALDSLHNPLIKAIFIGKGEDLSQRDYELYVGKVAHDQLPIFLCAADAFVLPTLREGCCNAIVEAMACGLPIVSSDRLFNHDILNEKNSIMVEPENVHDIAVAIKKLYDEYLLRKEMATAAFETAQKLDVSQRASNILQFLNEQMSIE